MTCSSLCHRRNKILEAYWRSSWTLKAYIAALPDNRCAVKQFGFETARGYRPVWNEEHWPAQKRPR